MQIHEITSTKKKKKKRIGRGGKRGNYSGKGIKGQRSRAGRKLKPAIRAVIKRYPKIRGYQFTPISKTHVLNIAFLDKSFKDQEIVSPESLRSKKLISKSKKMPVKILGKGEIKKPLTIKGCLISKKAKEKIEKAGGVIEEKPKVKNKKPKVQDKSQNDKEKSKKK